MSQKEKIPAIYFISNIRDFIDQDRIVRIWLAILTFGISELIMRVKLWSFIESIIYHDKMIQEALLVPILMIGEYTGNIVSSITKVVGLSLTNNPPDPNAVITEVKENEPSFTD